MDVKKSNVKTPEAAMEQKTYESSLDNMCRNDRPFEGTADSLPPAETNPIMGADGALPSKKISKLNGAGSGE